MPKKKLSKKELLEALRKMKEGGDSNAFLTDIGAVGVGAAGGCVAAFALGSTTASALFGLVAIPVAAPLAVVAGGTLLGGAALFGVKRLFEGTYHEGKKAELIRQMEGQLRDIEEKERKESVRASDRKEFHLFLVEPIEFDLITPEDAQNLMELVETGKLAISEAYKAVRDILNEYKGAQPAS